MGNSWEINGTNWMYACVYIYGYIYIIIHNRTYYGQI